MNSPIYNEWVEEERREAAEKASREAVEKNTRGKINEVLEVKFDFIPKYVRESIERIYDIDVLDGLFRKSIKVSSIEEFEELLKRVKMLS